MNTTSLQTVAWLIMGSTGSAPGVLRLGNGRLMFEAHGRGALTLGQLHTLEQRSGVPGLSGHLAEGGVAPLFDGPASQVKFPWYYFGGGMKLSVAGSSYRFSFLQPQNTQLPTELYDLPGIGTQISTGRAAGRAWRAALTAA
ncbi:hypothetical protein [Actinocorallia sp. A-T 12471]|uniref:hypothetical protein n=1 Tax=Actinocorallia sp. A-T 12471 TaxID=3089813 RepID=UPI0029CCE4A6|nr:hypothetical protein [Actinocorallia sp. A-T 12471]MDX6739259.1 hypothetical protein [Actinocorallia sp. A-T 12471]